ncbi:MAG: hypothetical protein AB1813_23465 [Verrucomicrobiota bacterium]
MQRVFLLSPAHCGGRRARMILNPEARFDLAMRLRQHGAPLGEVFSFMSGLYFRGKLAYARAFAHTTASIDGGVMVITPNRGLVPAHAKIGIKDLQQLGQVPVDPEEPRYVRPLRRDARALARGLGPADRVVLLGSIGTQKYAEVLLPILGDRLFFPSAFIGRGDMSRGGLLLRCVSDRTELEYIPVQGAIRKGRRPPKLEPRQRGYKIMHPEINCDPAQ